MYIQYNVWRWEALGMRKLCYKNTSKLIKMVETLIMENENAMHAHCFMRIEWMCLIHVYSKPMMLRPKKSLHFSQNLRFLLKIGLVMQCGLKLSVVEVEEHDNEFHVQVELSHCLSCIYFCMCSTFITSFSIIYLGFHFRQNQRRRRKK